MSKKLATDEQVEQQISDLRKTHTLGGLSIDGQAVELDGDASRLAVARRFANQSKRGYSEEQLDELCDLIRKHKPVFTVSHIILLLPVPWPKRRKLQRRCIKNNWSTSQLSAEKTRLLKPKSRGGRRPEVAGQDPVVKLKTQANNTCNMLKELKRSGIFDTLPAVLQSCCEAEEQASKRTRKWAQHYLKNTQEDA